LEQAQLVAVEIDGEDCPIDCRVATVLGSAVSLVCQGELEPRMRARLIGGARAFLVFTHRGAVIGLRGVVAAASKSPVIDFVVLDGIQAPERRRGARIICTTRARVSPTDSDSAGTEEPAVDTFTVNLSPTGAMLRRRPQLDGHQRFSIEFFFGADPVPLRADAVLVRLTRNALVLEFEHMNEADHVRLAEILAERRVSSQDTPRPASRVADNAA